MATDGDVLIVRHGPGRGRVPNYLQEVLDAIERDHRDVAVRLRRFHTGEAVPSLDGLAAVVFWLGDPVRELYPECYAVARRLADAARERGIRIVNDPDALSHTIKSVQAARWRAAGLPTPAHHRFETHTELRALVDVVRFPVILRAEERHAQIGMRVCQSADELLALPADVVHLPGSLCEFVDTRPSHRRWFRRPTLWGQLFHKKRQFIFGSRMRTSHLFFSSEPLVSSNTSLFHGNPDHPGDAMAKRQLDEAVALDVAYWERGTEHADVMHAAMDALGLDFAAIDYASLGDGRVMLWEANPYFFFPPMGARMLPERRRTTERVAGYHDEIAAFLGRLARGER